MKNIIEIVKANKEVFTKRALVVGGTMVGLAVVSAIVKKVMGTDREEIGECEGNNEVYPDTEI